MAATLLAVILSTARPLFPSEDADQGSGLVFIGLWGFAAVLWSCAQMARGELRITFRAVDGCVVLLGGLVVSSAFWSDTARPAINMASEWAGLVVSYFVVRQLFRTAATRSLLIRAMLATVVSLSALGIYQAFWGLEPLRLEYEQDPIRILKELNIAPGSHQHTAFENRLRSHEVFATFALANSLAGFIVAWLPLGLAWLAELLRRPPDADASGKHSARGPRPRMLAIVAAAIINLAALACLILTQSRTAYAAFLIELALLAAWFGPGLAGQLRQRVSAWILWASAAVVVLGIAALVALAVHRGKMDEKLLSEAFKSLSYRGQYWQSTVQMIRERPWTGTGVGNFRGHYLKHKLAESSEEIADPHNMILEIAATSGLVAAAMLLVVVAWSVTRLFRATSSTAEASGDRGHGPGSLLVVGVLGWSLALALSASDATQFVELCLIWVVAAVVLAFGTRGDWPPRVLAAGVLGLSINLLGAGGISMPGVAQSLWLLLALGLNAAEHAREAHVIRSPKLTRWIALAVTVALLGFWLEVLRPVTSSRSAMSQGRQMFLGGDRAGANVQYLAAAEYDDFSAEPWIELSRIHYQRWAESRGSLSDAQFDHAVGSLEEAVRLAPSRLEPITLLAELFEARARRDDHRGYWMHAAEAYGQCVEFYPTSARLRAKSAEALWQAGSPDAARAEAKRALELDAHSPHVDKKLRDAERRRLEELLEVQVTPKGATQ